MLSRKRTLIWKYQHQGVRQNQEKKWVDLSISWKTQKRRLQWQGVITILFPLQVRVKNFYHQV